MGEVRKADPVGLGHRGEVQEAADQYVDAAASVGAMPVLVAYNLPFRDCAQYSAGGAANTAAYEAWIDGLVAGIVKLDDLGLQRPSLDDVFLHLTGHRAQTTSDGSSRKAS